MTDDTAAIQAALASLPDGGTIWIPDGTYQIDATGDGGGVPLRSHQDLELSAGAVLRVIPNAAIEYGLVRIYGVTDVSVHGGTLVGDRDGHLGVDGEWGHGVNIRASDHVVIESVTATGMWGDGFYIGRNLTEPPASSEIVIADCVADGNRRQGLSITDAHDVAIWRSVFEHTHGTPPESGIDLEPSFDDRVVDHVVMSDNLFTGNTYGLMMVRYTGSVDDIVATDNEIADNAVTGVWLDGTPTRVSLEREAIHDNGIGIDLAGPSGATVAATHVFHNTQQGVRLVGSSGNVLTDNRIEANGDSTASFDNIELRDASGANSIMRNVVRRGDTPVSRYGIEIATPDCDSNMVIANDLIDAGAMGGLFDLGTGTIVQDNAP